MTFHSMALGHNSTKIEPTHSKRINMKAWIAAVALAGIVASGNVMAVSKIYGLGAASCGKFLSYANDDQEPYMFWFNGYATMASTESGIDYFKGTDGDSRLIWVRNYCQAHPLETFYDATVALMAELHKMQK